MTVGQDTRSSRLVRFGVFEADLRTGELRKNGLKIRLPGQPFEVLAIMLERPGEVVTREELQRRLWSDGTFVDFDHSLNNAINKIREALGDSAESPRFVETLSRRGYRFIAPVERLNLQVGSASADGNGRSGLDPGESYPAEFSIRPSENETVIKLAAASRPATPHKRAWFLQRRTLLAAGLVLLLATGLVWWSLRRPKPRELVLTRLTSDPGLTTDAVISPDGKLIAYASDRGGNNLDIWVKQVSGGEAIQLTKDPADDHQPSFSPDGSQIVFRSERDGGGIYIISALGGGEARLLAHKGRNPRFSPTGDLIAFWAGQIVGNVLGAQAGRIFLIPPTGGDSKPVDPPGIVAAGFPIWSPDGTHLLFYASDLSACAAWRPDSDWWVWPLAGGRPVKTGAFAAFAAQNISLSLPNPAPAPAEWIDDQVYFSAKAGDSVNLWQVSIQRKEWRIMGPAHRLPFGSGGDIRPSLAKTGLLVFSRLVENSDIWSLPIDASQGQVKGDLEQLTRDLAADYTPSMSADGKKVAYVSWRSGNAEIWMKDLESGKEKPLTESSAEATSPRMSPDGSLVSYAIRARESGWLANEICLVPTQGGLLQKLCDGCGGPYGWSPDNRLLFFSPGRGQYTIDMINLATRNAGNYLRSSQLGLYHATLTHDSRWITFNALDARSFPIRLQVLAAPFQLGTPPNESDWIKVVSDSHYNDKPRWSPDENRVYFVSDRDGFACLWSQSVDAGTKTPIGSPQELYHIHQVRRSILNVGWGLMDIAVARNRIVLNMSEITGNIWMTRIAEDH